MVRMLKAISRLNLGNARYCIFLIFRTLTCLSYNQKQNSMLVTKPTYRPTRKADSLKLFLVVHCLELNI